VDGAALARLAAAARDVPRAEHDRLTRQLANAGAGADVAALCAIFAADVVVVSDGGGAAPAGGRVVTGAGEAAWLVAALLARRAGVTVTPAQVNGRSGLVVHRGPDAIAVVSPEVAAGRIAALWVVRNPDKLRAWHRPKPAR
jgi:RNA polymerase sigma-70 factor (ECF subfamily)